MTVMCSENVKKRLIPLLKKYDLPTQITDDMKDLTELMSHDKKAVGKKIRTVFCNEIGSFEFRDMTPEEISAI